MLSLIWVLVLNAWGTENPCLGIRELRPFDFTLEKVGKSDTKILDWERLETGHIKLAKRFFTYPVIRKAHITDGVKISIAVDKEGAQNLKTTEVRIFIPRDDGTYEVHRAIEAPNGGVVSFPMEIQEKSPVSTGGVKVKNQNQYDPKIVGLSLEEIARHYFKMDGEDFSRIRKAFFGDKAQTALHAYAIANSEQSSEVMQSGMRKFNLTHEEIRKIIDSGNISFMIGTKENAQVKFEALLRSLHVIKKNTPELFGAAMKKLIP